MSTADGHGAHGHAHGVGTPASRLVIALGLTAVVGALEVAGGLVGHSLALLSDAAHVLMDVLALSVAVIAGRQATRPATLRMTYGHARWEILAALLNGGLLFAVTAFIVVEAVRRFLAPALPEGGIMLGIAATGLVVNGAIGVMLARDAHANLNVRAALFHVASDAVGALAVMIGGAVVLAWRVAWIDPLLSLFVSGIIIAGVVRIVRESADVLLEGAPPHADVPSVRARIRSLPGVVDVHDLHVWTIGSGSHVLSAHVLLRDAWISEASGILRDVDRAVREEFGITHVTVQFECESCDDDERTICTQVPTEPLRPSSSGPPRPAADRGEP